MRIERKRIAELIPAPYNPRKDLQVYDEEYEKLRRSLQEFGYVEPVIWNERTGYVVGGHQRLKVLRQLGETEIDCVIVDLPPEREKALNVALNKISNKWDMGKLNDLLEDLQETDIDITLTGFSTDELEELSKVEIDEPVDEPYDDSRKRENREQGYRNVNIDRTYNMYRLYEYDAERTSGVYQFPTVKASHYVPDHLLGFDELPVKYELPPKTGIHFFAHDYQIQCMWTRPYENIEKLSKYDCVLMPDFSTYWDMPMAMKIWNTYRMHLISQMMQDAGLEVIPIIRGLGDETLSWCYSALEPGGVYVYSTQGVKTTHGTFKDICRRELTGAIKELKPECIVLYGDDIGFDFQGVPVKQIPIRQWGMKLCYTDIRAS